jgi:ATP-dependent DNA helicase RecG
MDIVTKSLDAVRRCIENKSYQELETDRFEFKDLSGGWGNDFQKTVCAFLNGNGGIIVIGIQDKNNTKPPYYRFAGYLNSDANEKYLKQELPKLFKDREGKNVDVSQRFTVEIKDFLEGRVAILYVEELEAESKFVFYEGKAYKRVLTGDHEISPAEIESYEEIKREVIRNKELTTVADTSIENIDLEVLNNFIYEYNRGKRRGESLKKTKEEARTFLHHQGFMRDEQLTILGMLVCGNDPKYFIQGKCECDCYVIIPKAPQVAQNKEVIEDNIIELIRRSHSFVWRNIQVGIGYSNGGTALPEYPESLIRECINNAFAHRSYYDSRFVIIEIYPQKSLVIRNPGLFERRQRIYQDSNMGKIRRIVPLQVARNPKLTNLLKSFDYWEGRGKGLTSLIDACLDNEIDVPYYILSPEEIKLCIPKGKVYDQSIQVWIDSFAGYISQKANGELNKEEIIVLAFFKKSEELNRLERYTILITADNNHSGIIASLEEKGLIVRNPQSPELYPIYQVDRTLMKTDFSTELSAIFQETWAELKKDYQTVLQAIYQYNTFGEPNGIVSANSVANFLYLREKTQIIDIQDFGNFNRKVRNIFNKLETQTLIVRKSSKSKEDGGKSDFIINPNYKLPNTLFKI